MVSRRRQDHSLQRAPCSGSPTAGGISLRTRAVLVRIQLGAPIQFALNARLAQRKSASLTRRMSGVRSSQRVPFHASVAQSIFRKSGLPVFRRKCDQTRNLERIPAHFRFNVNGMRSSGKSTSSTRWGSVVRETHHSRTCSSVAERSPDKRSTLVRFQTGAPNTADSWPSGQAADS